MHADAALKISVRPASLARASSVIAIVRAVNEVALWSGRNRATDPAGAMLAARYVAARVVSDLTKDIAKAGRKASLSTNRDG